jgi:hypothetical protein
VAQIWWSRRTDRSWNTLRLPGSGRLFPHDHLVDPGARPQLTAGRIGAGAEQVRGEPEPDQHVAAG